MIPFDHTGIIFFINFWAVVFYFSYNENVVEIFVSMNEMKRTKIKGKKQISKRTAHTERDS